MRVRVWIEGPDGPSRDFELVSPPRVGERICIATTHGLEEGVVESITWQLQAVEATTTELLLEGDPPGSVSLLQVVCRRPPDALHQALAASAASEQASAPDR
ncbi:hypothetical protein PHZ_p0021 (plasmid) [Phenylobacterium zucineum HLK1]|uniref:Uncharacterized protein n=1 Tax=Phenylobacterium zucineum (strain HLK1) TaxID=450851 RepID=B4RHY9_PHEZH|nr:hypothetical protein [Phenylobacterium zucineum]ACG79964.1 hypothetical protein PHZ_p0021 [Phenylobacterium zucineum HLK1]